MPRSAQLVRQKQRRYAAELRRLERESLRIQQADLVRIRRLLATFFQDLAAVAPGQFELTQRTGAQVLAALQERVADLSGGMFQVITDGMRREIAVADATMRAYVATFLPEGAGIPIVGADLTLLNTAAQFSAELVGLRQGGLGAQMLSKVNRELRLAALGGQGRMSAIDAIHRALGKQRPWLWQAERIYRTETLRIHSIVSDAGIKRLNEITPTGKAWMWSGISRVEHARIDGQTVPANGRFKVPLPSGGTVSMLYPRDGEAPAAATVNCGCFVVPKALDQTVAAGDARAAA